MEDKGYINIEEIAAKVASEEPRMQKELTYKFAEYLINFYGPYDSVLDNRLDPEDRWMFHLAEDYDMVNRREEKENLPIDGRAWRTYFWDIKSREIRTLAVRAIKEEPTLEELYNEEIPEDVWARA